MVVAVLNFFDLIHRGSSFARNKRVSRVNTSAEQQMFRIQFVSDISIYESFLFGLFLAVDLEIII